MINTDKVLKTEIVYHGPLLKIQKDTVQLANGQPHFREFILHPGAAIVICLNEKKEFLISRQYRHPLQRVVCEFPAGKCDPGEDSLETARRELQEETGVKAQKIEKIGRVHPCVAYANEYIDAFLVTEFTQGPTNLDEGENIESEWISKARLVELINTGQFTDGKSLAALTLLLFGNGL